MTPADFLQSLESVLQQRRIAFSRAAAIAFDTRFSASRHCSAYLIVGGAGSSLATHASGPEQSEPFAFCCVCGWLGKVLSLFRRGPLERRLSASMVCRRLSRGDGGVFSCAASGCPWRRRVDAARECAMLCAREGC